MDMWNYLAGGAAVGLIASCWSKIKDIVWRVTSLLIQQVEIDSEPAHDALIAYLIAHYRRSRLYDRMYGASREHQRDGRYGLVPYEVFGPRTVVFWNGWWPFVFSNAVETKGPGQPGSTHGSGSSDATKVYSTITFLRGTARRRGHAPQGLRRRQSTVLGRRGRRGEGQEPLRHPLTSRSAATRTTMHDHGSNGLAWYQQGYYRLLAHTPDQLGKAPLHNGSALSNLIFPARGQGPDPGDRAVAQAPGLVSRQGHPVEARLAALRPAGHRQDGPGPRLRRRPEHADLRLQPGGDEQPRADQGVERHAGQRAVHRPDRGHRQRLPRPRERRPQGRPDAVAGRPQEEGRQGRRPRRRSRR